MRSVTVNNVVFRGQYGDALNSLLSGEIVTIRHFRNGSWEATTQIRRFLQLLNIANIKYKNISNNNSLRSIKLIKT
jgi:hypothetical protein